MIVDGIGGWVIMTSIRDSRSTIILAFSTFIGVLAGQYPNTRAI